MALLDYQSAISLDTLYEVKLAPIGQSNEQLNMSIWANDLVSIYGSNSATQPAALSDMTL